MDSLMHSGSGPFKPFSVGIWQSHPLQQHTPSPPGLNVYMKENVNYKEKTPTEGGELVQHCSTPPSW